MILLLIILIILSALLSASETALFSLSPLTIKSYRGGSGREKLIAHLMERPRDVLVTILMLNVLANILVQNVVSNLFDAFPDWSLRVGVPLGLTLVFGEVVPKSIALTRNSAIAKRAAPWVAKIARWLGPLRRSITALTGWISRVLFFFLREAPEMSGEEFRHILSTSKEKGVITPEEARLTSGLLDLQEKTAKELMRPREEILFYNLNDPIEELIHLFVDLECTRVPVSDGPLDRLLGILPAGEFFLHRGKRDLRPHLERPLYVPETTHGWPLLQMMRSKKEDLAIVVDEYGSISGLLSQEDLIESVVGEIQDLRDTASHYTRSGQDVLIASGKLELSEFNAVMGANLRSIENVTLGGWLVEQLGDIPEAGEQYATDEFLFYILAADPNRVRRVYVRKVKR